MGVLPAVLVPVAEMSVTAVPPNRTAISVHRGTGIYAGCGVDRVVLIHYPRRSYHEGPSHHDRVAYDPFLYHDRGLPPLFVGVDLSIVVSRSCPVTAVRERR